MITRVFAFLSLQFLIWVLAVIAGMWSHKASIILMAFQKLVVVVAIIYLAFVTYIRLSMKLGQDKRRKP